MEQRRESFDKIQRSKVDDILGKQVKIPQKSKVNFLQVVKEKITGNKAVSKKYT